MATQRILDFLATRRPNGPCLVVDLDVGVDETVEQSTVGGPLDPHTMTEIGTKLDLARAYIDMGDPEGARSIREEVLDEGDAGQRREAQSLIEGLAV